MFECFTLKRISGFVVRLLHQKVNMLCRPSLMKCCSKVRRFA